MKSSIRRASCGGFTLIELLIAIVVLAILLAIAIPSYSRFVLRSKLQAAKGDLSALALASENFLQRKLTYYGSNLTTTAAVKGVFATWSPQTASDFDYSYEATADGYTVKAVYAGGDALLTSCELSISHDNVKSISNCSRVGGAGSSW